ncbi:hypothetical protein [Streptomyces sp. NPDC014734]
MADRDADEHGGNCAADEAADDAVDDAERDFDQVDGSGPVIAAVGRQIRL